MFVLPGSMPGLTNGELFEGELHLVVDRRNANGTPSRWISRIRLLFEAHALTFMQLIEAVSFNR
jgi:hypothetical protein